MFLFHSITFVVKFEKEDFFIYVYMTWRVFFLQMTEFVIQYINSRGRQRAPVL